MEQQTLVRLQFVILLDNKNEWPLWDAAFVLLT